MFRSSCWRTFRGLLASFLAAALLLSLPGSAWAGGVTWTARSAAVDTDWRGLTYGNGLFVAVAWTGANRVMTSPDGITWTARSAAEANPWLAVTYGNGLFVAVANDGTNRVMTSPDGITWTARAAAEANSWRQVTYGNGLFVAVAYDGTNRVMTSPDGTTWTARSAPEANQWWGVTYGNDLFVAVAVDGTNRVMTSPDGITWTARSATEANMWWDLIYANGLFVAVSENGTNRVMTSPDGITWTARSATEANQWVDVTYGNGLFVAVTGTGTNRVMTSPDGITWTARAAAEANDWWAVTYGNDLFVAVARTGTGTNRVMTSDATPPGFTLSTSTATVSETGTTATFTVVLDAQPGSDVVFSVVSADTGEATVDKATLTFTNANWNSSQTVTVTGIDDAVVDGDQATTITVAVVDASSDDSYDALADQTVTATTTHNDDPPPPPGVSDVCNTTGTIWMAPFADVGQSSPVHADVGCLYHSGVVLDDGSGLYRPDEVTTRAEMVTFAARTLGPVGGLCPSRVPPFTDMDSASPIAGELACMYGLGVVRGRTGTTFDPDTAVTRAETAAIISRFYQAVSRPRWSASCSAAANPFNDTTRHWSEPNITCVNALGIITGTTTGTFSPQATVTRAEAATMWKKTLVSLL